jgi:hypothetical protein
MVWSDVTVLLSSAIESVYLILKLVLLNSCFFPFYLILCPTVISPNGACDYVACESFFNLLAIVL